MQPSRPRRTTFKGVSAAGCRTRRGRSACGFSLVELLAVVAIIGVLVAIVLVVGAAVINNQKKETTRSTIRLLEQILDEYSNTTGETAPAYVEDDANVGGTTALVPIADAENGGALINSLGLFLLSMPESASGIGDQIQTELRSVAFNGGTWDDQNSYLTPLDSWGQPIRFVHPAWDGTYEQLRDDGFTSFPRVPPADGSSPRSPRERLIDSNVNPTRNADNSDAGICPAGRAYFYSVGPDGLAANNAASGDASGREDNVYTVEPEFAE